MHITLGSRGSTLALAQTKIVKEALEQCYPQHTFEIIVIQTKGDQIQDRPLDKIGDKGIFISEIEQQLLQNKIDIGVHSMKDMPGIAHPELRYTKIWKREDARDVLVLKNAKSLYDLPPHAVIATGSKRRAYQLKRIRPDIEVVGIRGNVDTRLAKMQSQNIDGLIIAAAGLHRLQLQHLISEYLSVQDMVPACGQGALALEVRKDDEMLKEMVDALHDENDTICVESERIFLNEVNGGCHIPVGAYCEKVEDGFRFIAVLGNENNEMIYQDEMIGKNPNKLAQTLAHKLLEKVGSYHE